MSASVLFAVAALWLVQAGDAHPACGAPPPAWTPPPPATWHPPPPAVCGPPPPVWAPACGPAPPRRAPGPVHVSLPGVEGGVLSVISGGPMSPEGLSFSSQNEISGPLGVSGTLPFATAVSLSGSVASGGHASVAYSTAPGLAVSGGCGQGLAGHSGHAPHPHPAPRPHHAPSPSPPCTACGGGCGCPW